MEVTQESLDLYGILAAGMTSSTIGKLETLTRCAWEAESLLRG